MTALKSGFGFFIPMNGTGLSISGGLPGQHGTNDCRQYRLRHGTALTDGLWDTPSWFVMNRERAGLSAPMATSRIASWLRRKCRPNNGAFIW